MNTEIFCNDKNETVRKCEVTCPHCKQIVVVYFRSPEFTSPELEYWRNRSIKLEEMLHGYLRGPNFVNTIPTKNEP